MPDILSPNKMIVTLTANIVTAYVTKHTMPANQLPELIKEVHAALEGLGDPVVVPEDVPNKLVPAVSIRRSVREDYLICLDDGKKFKTLKRHLMVKYGMTPQDYRAKWDLPEDYPMTAPGYTERRSALAKENGLGRKVSKRRAMAAPVS